MAINELRAIATFAKAVESGSIRRAAVAQGVTPQAASQAIAQLESHLGVRLLHRAREDRGSLAAERHGPQLRRGAGLYRWVAIDPDAGGGLTAACRPFNVCAPAENGTRTS